MLLVNYKSTHDDKQFRLYYECLKDYDEKAVLKAVLETIKNNRYFPNVNEIIVNMPKKNTLDEWDNIRKEPLNEEEKQELEKIKEMV